MSPETQQAWPGPNSGGGQVPTQEQYGTSVTTAYRRPAADPAAGGEPSNGVAYEPPADRPKLPSLDPEAPPEPQFSVESWLDAPVGNLADHPLLRGLLLELPPKGSTPSPGWLDRWFEATRSILELLYIR